MAGENQMGERFGDHCMELREYGADYCSSISLYLGYASPLEP